MQDNVLAKAMKITNQLFSIEDEKEPESMWKIGYRDYLTFATKLEDTAYFK